MVNRYDLGLCLLLMLALLPVPVRGEPLPWALLPLPGVVELQEDGPPSGMQVEALRLLEARMPDIQPSYRAVNYRRLQQDMAQGMDFCAAPFFRRADSDRIGYFVPYVVSTPIQLVIRADALERFSPRGGRVSLARLLEDPALQGGLSSSRTYPDDLLPLLERGLRNGRLQWIGGASGGQNLLLMVGSGRLDYSFEFSTIVDSMAADPRLRAPLQSVPLQERLALVESGIYCTRSAWGLRMARRLDTAVREVAREPQALLQLYRRNLPPQIYAVYRDKLRAYYRERADQVPLQP